MNPSVVPYPPWFSELKREIASSYPDFEARITQAWKEVIEDLSEATSKIHQAGPDVGSSRFSTGGRLMFLEFL